MRGRGWHLSRQFEQYGGKNLVINCRFALLAMLLATTSLQASPVFVGSFDFGGTITVTEEKISWNLFVAPNLLSEKALVQAADGIYDGLIEGTLLTIRDLNRSTAPVDPFPNPPATIFGPFAFVSFDGQPSLSILNINHIFEGVEGFAQCLTLPAAAGQHCTPSGPQFGGPSPFSFTNKAGGGSTASFTFEGVGPNGLVWIGEFTAQFSVPYQTVLAAFNPGNPNASHRITNSYSGTITVSQVPESATLSLGGIGLLGLCFAMKRLTPKA